MKRYRYDSIIKGAFNTIGYTVFFLSLLYFILMISVDKEVSYISLILTIIGILLIGFGFLLRLLLRIVDKCCVIFVNGTIHYKEKSFYDCNIKYIKFSLSIIEESLVIPKLYINNGIDSLTVYLTKKDVKKLIKQGYRIEIS